MCQAETKESRALRRPGTGEGRLTFPRRIGRSTLVTGVLALSVVTGQGDIRKTDLENHVTVGLTDGGASGLFVNPTPATLGTGHFGIGLLLESRIWSRQTIKNLPVALGFGLSDRAEAFGSFVSLSSTQGTDEEHSTFGLKVNLFRTVPGSHIVFSTDVRIQRLIQSFDSGKSQETRAVSASVIANHPLGKVALSHVHIGYRWAGETELHLRNRIIGGAGVTYPVSDYFLILGEFHTRERLNETGGIRARAGVKWFFLRHIQFAFGIQGSYDGQPSFDSFSLGVAFVTETLRAGTGKRHRTSTGLPEPPPLEEMEISDDEENGERIDR